MDVINASLASPVSEDDCFNSTLNCTANCTTLTHQDVNVKDAFLTAARYTRNVLIPIITLLGFFGNTLSLWVFRCNRVKRSACFTFLVALAAVDNLFLACVLLNWIDGEWHFLPITPFICQIQIFVSYMSSCLSVWLIVAFTTERFCAICLPLKLNICGTSKERVVVILLTLIGCAIYQFTFWTVTVYDYDSYSVCSYKTEYFDFMKIATWTDTAITMIIPYILISLANATVWYRVRNRSILRNASQFRRQLQRKTTNVFWRKGAVKAKSRINSRLTWMLLLVSTSFLFLNLPSHSMRLFNLIKGSNNHTVSTIYYFAQEMTLMLSYISHSCNFLLYTWSSHSFKNNLRSVLHIKKSSDNRYRPTQGNIVETVSARESSV